MKRNTLYVLLALCTAVPFHALGQRTCGTGDHFQQALLKDPSLLQRTKDAKALSEQWLNKHPASTLKKTGTVITIPVVVHVIYENNAENISDAQVISQIDVLNRDFRKLNVDTGNVPIGFQGLAADVEVEFCLAVRDPNGNPTNGITRTPTTQTDFSNADPKSTAQGGKDGWPNNDYLNFWVCDLGGGLLGYATFPGGNPSQDGVVCLYTSIGEPPANPFGGSFNKGRTATHEIGHYLGLSHTFQGGCAGTTLSNCGSSGDGICDTPPTSSPNYGCPSVTQNSCSESPADENDMHMNYMDYVDDGCMNLFTYGQKSRMLSVLNTSRSSLQNSLGCMSLSVLDASVSLLAPTDTLCGSNQFAPKVMLHNFGSATLTGATI
ncbi:MAG: zinc metalloprotease, partial [Flavobacteriales bacterium]|nr:zinc metalloprotease [Flavobacteriales bacterium]